MSEWDCGFEGRCLNGPGGKEECYRCTNQHLLKLPEDKARQQAMRRASSVASVDTLAAEDSWKQLEKDVANKLNANPYRTFQEAHRQLRSGGIWFLPGDVADTIVLEECKERTTYTAKGKQTFNVEREWLEKVIEEGNQVGRFPGLCFRYKGDARIYSVKPFEVECDMVHLIKTLMDENAELRAKLEGKV